MDDYSLFPVAAHTVEVCAPSAGVVQSIDAAEVGIGGMLLGAGRRVASDEVDHGVGVTVHKHVGDEVAAGEPLVTLAYNADKSLTDATNRILDAYDIGPDPVEKGPLVIDIIRGEPV